MSCSSKLSSTEFEGSAYGLFSPAATHPSIEGPQVKNKPIQSWVAVVSVWSCLSAGATLTDLVSTCRQMGEGVWEEQARTYLFFLFLLLLLLFLFFEISWMATGHPRPALMMHTAPANNRRARQLWEAPVKM